MDGTPDNDLKTRPSHIHLLRTVFLLELMHHLGFLRDRATRL
jgi:hypothetical protein